MDAFARRLPYLLAWLQQALAVTEGHACGIGVLARDAAVAPPPRRTRKRAIHLAPPMSVLPERERDEDNGLTYADPRDERKARREGTG